MGQPGGKNGSTTPSTWACHLCTLENSSRKRRCAACGARRETEATTATQKRPRSPRSTEHSNEKSSGTTSTGDNDDKDRSQLIKVSLRVGNHRQTTKQLWAQSLVVPVGMASCSETESTKATSASTDEATNHPSNHDLNIDQVMAEQNQDADTRPDSLPNVPKNEVQQQQQQQQQPQREEPTVERSASGIDSPDRIQTSLCEESTTDTGTSNDIPTSSTLPHADQTDSSAPSPQHTKANSHILETNVSCLDTNTTTNVTQAAATASSTTTTPTQPIQSPKSFLPAPTILNSTHKASYNPSLTGPMAAVQGTPASQSSGIHSSFDYGACPLYPSQPIESQSPIPTQDAPVTVSTNRTYLCTTHESGAVEVSSPQPPPPQQHQPNPPTRTPPPNATQASVLSVESLAAESKHKDFVAFQYTPPTQDEGFPTSPSPPSVQALLHEKAHGHNNLIDSHPISPPPPQALLPDASILPPIPESAPNDHIEDDDDDSSAMEEVGDNEAVRAPTYHGVAAFQTAGSKATIHVDPERLHQAHQFLDSEHDGTMKLLNKNHVKNVPTRLATKGSKTAASILHVQDQVAERVLDDSATLTSTVSTKTSSIVAAFQTAGTKTFIAVDEHSLQKAQQLLSMPQDRGSNRDPPAPATSFGATFQTAGTKSTISVDATSLEQAQRLLREEESSHRPRPPTETLRPLKRPNRGFLTEKEVSQRAPQRRRLDLEQASRAVPRKRDEAPQSVAPRKMFCNATTSPSMPTTVAAFATSGSRTLVQVSAASLARATKLLEASSSESERKRPASENSTVATVNGTAPVAAFATAGTNSTIQVSEASLAQATKLLSRNTDAARGNTTVDPFTVKPLVARTTPKDGLEIPVVAFATARSNTRVKVSSASLAKATMLLGGSEEAKLPAVVDSVATSTSMPVAGFTTAGTNTKIHVSETSLVQARKLLASSVEAIDGTKIAPRKSNFSAASKKESDGLFTAFTTAGSHSRVVVDATSLARATELLEGRRREEPRSPAIMDSAAATVAPMIPLAAFATAGSKSTIRVSETSLARAKAVLSERSSEATRNLAKGPNTSTLSVVSQGKAKRLVAAFTTTDINTTIQVSESSLEHEGSRKSSTKEISTDMAPTAFTTAGANKRIQVSEESWRKVSMALDSKPKASFFTVGSNKEVQVTNEGLEKASKLFAQDTPEAVSQGVTTESSSSNTAKPAFVIAGSRKILHVSESDMAKASILLKDTASETRKIQEDECSPWKPMQVGFSTAGPQQEIKVSEETLAVAEQMLSFESEKKPKRQRKIRFSEENVPSASQFREESVAASMNGRIDVHVSFATAESNTNIEVSENSLQVAAKLLTHDTLMVTDRPSRRREDSSNIRGNIGQVGFATAGLNSAIKVTEQSLNQATKLLGEACVGGTIDMSPKYPEHDSIFSTPMVASHSVAFPHSTLDVSESSIVTGAAGTEKNEGMASAERSNQSSITTADYTASRLKDAFLNVDRHEVNKKLFATNSESQSTPKPMSSTREGNRINTQQIDTDMTRERASSTRSSTVTPAARKLQAPGRVTPLPNESSIQMHAESSYDSESKESPSIDRNTASPMHVSLQRLPLITPQTAVRRKPAQDFETVEEVEADKIQLADDGEDEYFRGTPPKQEERQVGNSETTNMELAVSEITRGITSENAVDLLFDTITGLPTVCDNEKKCGGKSHPGELAHIRNELVSRGCNGDLLSDVWISNHKQWIVWSLAGFERTFPLRLGGRHLTYEKLLEKMETRFRKEFHDGKRSAVRIILNGDMTASRAMILAVSRVFPSTEESHGHSTEVPQRKVSIELSDCWYPINAVLDPFLQSLVMKGVIRVGTKLLVSSAFLEGAKDGIDPLDDQYISQNPESKPALVLRSNCTRLAKWNSKLGFLKHKGLITGKDLIVKRVSDIILDGGEISKLRVTVTRLYPMLYLEKGPQINRNVLCEADEQRRREEFEKKKTNAVENLVETIREEVEKEIDEYAPDIWRKFQASDGQDVDSMSDEEQTVLKSWLELRRQQMQVRIKDELEAKLEDDSSLVRQSTPFVRAKVHTFLPGIEASSKEEGLLTLWNPTEPQLQALKEGSNVEIDNASVRTDFYLGLMQLTINARNSIRSLEPSTSGGTPSDVFRPRKVLSLFGLYAIARAAFRSESSRGTEVDVKAFVLPDLEQNTAANEPCSLTLFDESNLLLKLHVDATPHHLVRFLNGVTAVGGRPTLKQLSFRDLEILPFDSSLGFAVARYTTTSSFSVLDCKSHPTSSWQMLSTYTMSGYPLRPGKSPSMMIGYILEAKAIGDNTLRLQVDSGVRIDELKVSASVLEKALTTANEELRELKGGNKMSIQDSRSCSLSSLYRTRSILWKFCLETHPTIGRMSMASRTEVAMLHASLQSTAAWKQK